MTRWYRTGVSHGRHQRECSDVHDHADLVAPIALYDARLVKSRGLHDGSRPVATRIELLTVDHAVGDRVAHPEDRDAAGDEALDLVHVEALVDPADEQGLGRVGLRADLTVLALVDLVGRDDQREDAERRLGEGLRPRRTPRAHADVGVHVELLPARGGAVLHSRSPSRLWRTAMIAGPAVSDLRIRGPTPTTLQPPAPTRPISLRDSPPPGPTRKCTRAPFGRGGGRVWGGGVPGKRAFPPPPPRPAPA